MVQVTEVFLWGTQGCCIGNIIEFILGKLYFLSFGNTEMAEVLEIPYYHYGDIAWMSWHLKLLAIPLFI